MASIGPGNMSCAEFANLYAQDPPGTERVFYAWAEGYMTGLNLTLLRMSGSSQNLSGKYGMPGQEQELRGYCNAHPLASFQQAVNALFDSLEPNHQIKPSK